MKKKLMILLSMTAILFSLFAVPAFASCDDCIASTEGFNWSEHCEDRCTCLWEYCSSCEDQSSLLGSFCGATHQYTFTVTDGVHTGTCSCGATITGECDFVLKSTTPSTCQTEGYESYLCAVCDTPKTVMLPVGDHSYPMEPNKIYAATCTTGGYTEWICESCDHVKTTDWVEALGHSWEETTKAAECEAPGYVYKICTVCKLEEITEIKAAGHVLVEANRVAATCQAEGRIDYVCSTCGEETSERLPKITHVFANGICTMCAVPEVEIIVPPAVNPGGSSGGSSDANGGSSGSIFLPDLDAGDPEVLFKHLVGILAAVALFVGVMYFLARDKDK